MRHSSNGTCTSGLGIHLRGSGDRRRWRTSIGRGRRSGRSYRSRARDLAGWANSRVRHFLAWVDLLFVAGFDQGPVGWWYTRSGRLDWVSRRIGALRPCSTLATPCREAAWRSESCGPTAAYPHIDSRTDWLGLSAVVWSCSWTVIFTVGLAVRTVGVAIASLCYRGGRRCGLL